MVEAYTELLKRRYRTGVCSFAYLFSLSCTAFVIIVPYLLAYNSHGFWRRENTYFEQPHVQYTHKVILLLSGYEVTDPGRPHDTVPLQLYYSSMPAVNAFHEDNLRASVLKSEEVDTDNDGLNDMIMVEATMPLRPTEAIYACTMLVFVQYRLNDRVKLEMESLVTVDHSSSVPGKSISTFGDIALSQIQPLSVRGGYKQPYSNSPLLDSQTVNSAEETFVPTIIEKYSARNETTALSSAYNVWNQDAPLSYDHIQKKTFVSKVKVRIPRNEVLYTPEISETLKFAWIQYFSVFVIIFYLVDTVQAFVYSSQIFETTVSSDLTVGSKPHRF